MTVTSRACKHMTTCSSDVILSHLIWRKTHRVRITGNMYWVFFVALKFSFLFFRFILVSPCGHCFSFSGVDVAISTFPPIARVTSRNYTIVVGHSARLYCYGMSGISTVYPDRYSWRKDGEIRTGHRGFIGIPNAHHHDKGVYTCTLRNTAGFVTIKYEVVVVGKHYYLCFLMLLSILCRKSKGFYP